MITVSWTHSTWLTYSLLLSDAAMSITNAVGLTLQVNANFCLPVCAMISV